MTDYKLRDVFGIGVGYSTPAYVDRDKLDQRLQDGLAANRHVSVRGGSKQGKTWLRKKGLNAEECIVAQATISSTSVSILEEALARLGVTARLTRTTAGGLSGEIKLDVHAQGKISAWFAKGEASAGGQAALTGQHETVVAEEFLAQSVANLHWVAQAITLSDKILVIEDFHYLPEDEQRTFAYWMKALGEYGCHVMVIGVWAQSHLLSYFNGDLEGRVDDIALVWNDYELGEVLDRGSRALQIRMDPALRAAIIEDAYGNVGLLHRLMYEVCVLHDVDDLPPLSEIQLDQRLDEARSHVADQMAGRFQTFASNFVRGMRRMSEGLIVYHHLLRAITSASDQELKGDGIDSKKLLETIRSNSVPIRQSDLTQALERVDQLQAKIRVSPPVISYHRAGKKIQLLDRSFLFYRKYGDTTWPWDDPEPIENDLATSDPLAFRD